MVAAGQVLILPIIVAPKDSDAELSIQVSTLVHVPTDGWHLHQG